MSFSEREVSIIRETWAPIRTSPATWPRVFIMMFVECPETKKPFKSFANVPNDELANNKHLKAHVASVISLLSGFVDMIDDLDTMVEMIKSTATRHYKRKIPIPMFEKLGVFVIKWLKETVGDKVNDEAVAVWTKLFTSLVSIVKAQYAELDKVSS